MVDLRAWFVKEPYVDMLILKTLRGCQLVSLWLKL